WTETPSRWPYTPSTVSGSGNSANKIIGFFQDLKNQRRAYKKQGMFLKAHRQSYKELSEN
ncbi:MAG: hypothetical protein J6P96_06435, partial [Bacteroidaceae bacterium]|nr:hypothetical protein [Bacteroidaceae bacterium]